MQSVVRLSFPLLLTWLGMGCRFGFEAHANEIGAPGAFDGSDGASPPPDDAGSRTPTDAGHDAGAVDEPHDAGGPELPDAGPEDAGLDAATAIEVDAGFQPLTVAFASAGSTDTVGGTGGAPFSEGCPAGYAIVGYRGFVSSDPSYDWVMRLRAVCGRVTVESAAATEVTLGGTTLLAERGTDGDVAFTRECPANQVLVGFQGRAGAYLDQLVFTCAPLEVDMTGTTPTFTTGTTTDLATIGGGGGGSFAAQRCPAGQVAYAQAGRAGQWVDALTLYCGIPTALWREPSPDPTSGAQRGISPPEHTAPGPQSASS